MRIAGDMPLKKLMRKSGGKRVWSTEVMLPSPPTQDVHTLIPSTCQGCIAGRMKGAAGINIVHHLNPRSGDFPRISRQESQGPQRESSGKSNGQSDA